MLPSVRPPYRKTRQVTMALFTTLSLLLLLATLRSFTSSQSGELLQDCATCPEPCSPCPEMPVCPTFRPSSRCPPQLTKTAEQCRGETDFAKLMEDRRHLVHEHCANNFYSQKRAAEVFYFDKGSPDGVAWCPVYKAASSTTSAHFCPLYYDDCTDLGAQIWRKANFSRDLVEAETPTLLIVRNPFERLLSAYRDKVQSPNPDDPFLEPIIMEILGTQRIIPPTLLLSKKKLLKHAVDQSREYLQSQPNFNRGHQSSIFGSPNPYVRPISATFEEFIRGALQGFKWGSAHWSPVWSQCAPCSEDYDYIIKSERYHCEFPEFLRTINGTEDGSSISEKHVNFNPVRAGKDNSEFYQFYGSLPDNLLESLHDWYRPDCEMFGYDCEGMMCEIREWKRLQS